ncbi:uncharacterized protein DUF4230 [Arcicella aurantiaca]|jgi:hypothetical protein|uniref:Uncharacterized protein DUF4230 n=1 Tax=Arcicella aurantiaca TaxID=591202 RepID=A0A316ENB3_9BACT|nr:DUF4230 domain-containing protein [Arcicella aurantiaca]PWK24460.1 uncharacterized protein DUF4230 [Arcicella aurantiaca]
MLSILNIVFCLIGIAAGFGIFSVYNKFTNKEGMLIKNESTVLLEKIEKVFKIVLAEGHFSEIYDHTSEKEVLFGLHTLNKKALIVAKAKVLVGFDFAKVKVRWEEGSRKMIIEEFPEPEILSTDSDYKFYDIDQGLFNKFKNEEYTALLADAKQTMQNKAIASELPKIAKKQAVVMLTQMASSMGWDIDFRLPSAEQKLLEL